MRFNVRHKVKTPEYLEIKIKYFDKDLPRLKKIDKGDWIDLYAAETVTIRRGNFHYIRLGVGMILPEGYEAHIVPRSSTLKNFDIVMANSVGIIDNSYSGNNDEWSFPAIALHDTIINKGSRIAQFRLVKSMPKVDLHEVDKLNDVDRGGLGSTGITKF